MCAEPMTVTHTITQFNNPYRQRLGGDQVVAAQRYRVTSTIYAISLASDSSVDVCDVYIGQTGEYQYRHRIGPGSPYIGRIPAGETIFIRPVKYFDAFLSIFPRPEFFGEGDLTGPILNVLKLNIHTGCPPASLPDKRAASFFSVVAASESPGSPARSALVASGRTRVSIVGSMEWIAGTNQVTVTYAGIDYHQKNAAGVVARTETVLATITVLGESLPAYQYEGVAFDAFEVYVEPIDVAAVYIARFGFAVED